MKINELTRFPYPVLEEFTDDYISGEFSVNIEISESVKTGGLLIHYEIQLTEETINKLLVEDNAKPGLFVTCLESYYNHFHPISLPNGTLEIENGALHGNVVLLPLIVLSDSFLMSAHSNLHGDYANQQFDLDKGAVLAIGSDFVINVGREKLSPIESIFNLAVNDNIPPNQYSVDLDEEKITILAERNTYESIYSIRNTTPGKSIILNSVYLPVLMEVLSTLQQDPGPYQDKRWFKVFNAKCTHENINLDNPELLKDAQKLFRSPLQRAIDVMKEMD